MHGTGAECGSFTRQSASSKGPRVLLVTKHRSGGGTEKHVLEVSEALGVNVAYLEDGLWSIVGKIQDADIVHFFLPKPYVIGSLAAFGKTRIMSRRSLRSCYQTALIRWIEERLHKRTKILVANSPAVVNELRQEVDPLTYEGIGGHQIRLIRPGINFRPLPREKNPTFFVVCVANHFAYKGLEDLVKAYRMIRNALPNPNHLILIGRGTEKLEYGLGWRTDIRSWLGIAGVYVQPSHEEGASNALLEAMAAGCACIATDVGGNRDMIEHGVSGVLVPPKDPNRLADAILQSAKCRAQFADMGANAQIVVQKRFGFDRMIEEYRQLYRDACGKG